MKMKKGQKRLSKVFAVLLTAAMMFGISTSALAATPVNITGTNTVTLTREVTSAAPVTNTFTYTVAEVPGNPVTPGGVSAVTGIMPTGTVVFTGAEVPVGTTYTQTGTVDFSALTFSEPGDYYFRITETGSTNTVVYPIQNTPDDIYDAIVYVRWDAAHTSLVATLLANVQQQSSGSKVLHKVPGSAVSTHISLEKTISGNMADPDEYFAFEITVSGGVAVTYDLNGLDAAPEYPKGTSVVNPTTISAGTATTVYLKGGQTVTIGLNGVTEQVPVGATYTITESVGSFTRPDGSVANPYTTTIDGSAITGGPLAAMTTGALTTDVTPANNEVAYDNEWDETTPTGVMMDILPYALIVLLAAAGMIVFVTSKRRKASRR